MRISPNSLAATCCRRTNPLASLLWAAVLALSNGCGDDPAADDEGDAGQSGTCGTQTCPSHASCDQSGGSPFCACNTGYRGTTCAECESGYTLDDTGECHPAAIDCATDPSACGSTGSCVSDPDGDRCQCLPEYSGPTCAQCASGYQDNNSDGVCSPSCASGGLACPAPTLCNDASGSALCTCPEGYTGNDCAQCALGWVELVPGYGCVPTCDRVAQCVVGECVDFSGPAQCLCPPGRTGERCDECTSPDLVVGSDNLCRAPIESVASGTLLAHLNVDYQDHMLAAIDPVTGQLTPVGESLVANYTTDIAWDAENGEVYAVANMTVERRVAGDTTPDIVVDLTDVAEDADALVGPAYDAANNRLFVVIRPYWSVPASDSRLLTINPQNGEIIGDVTLPLVLVTSLDWDPDDELLWLLTPLSLDTYDPVNGSHERVLSHNLPTTLALGNLPGAISQGSFILATPESDPTLWLRRHCALAAERVGADVGALQGVGTYQSVAPDSGIVDLTSGGAQPSLVIFGSRATPSDPTLTINVDTDHPDDVVCLILSSQPAQIVVPEGAAFHNLLVVTSGAPVSVTIPEDFPVEPGNRAALVTVAADASLTLTTTFSSAIALALSDVGMNSLQPDNYTLENLLFIDLDDGTWRSLPLQPGPWSISGVAVQP